MYSTIRYCDVEYLALTQPRNERERRIIEAHRDRMGQTGDILLFPSFFINCPLDKKYPYVDTPTLLYRTSEETVIIDARDRSPLDYEGKANGHKLRYIHWTSDDIPIFPIGVINPRPNIPSNLYYLFRRFHLPANYPQDYRQFSASWTVEGEDIVIRISTKYFCREKLDVMQMKIDKDKRLLLLYLGRFHYIGQCVGNMWR